MKGRMAGLNLIAHMSGERCMMIQKNVHPSMNATCFTLDEESREQGRPKPWLLLGYCFLYRTNLHIVVIHNGSFLMRGQTENEGLRTKKNEQGKYFDRTKTS